jgi:hypothetical protein
VWKIHLENKEPALEFTIGGKPFASHIIPETAPLATVNTQEEAKQVMQDLIAQGIRAEDIYAVGFELPSTASVDA